MLTGDACEMINTEVPMICKGYVPSCRSTFLMYIIKNAKNAFGKCNLIFLKFICKMCDTML